MRAQASGDGVHVGGFPVPYILNSIPRRVRVGHRLTFKADKVRYSFGNSTASNVASHASIAAFAAASDALNPSPSPVAISRIDKACDNAFSKFIVRPASASFCAVSKPSCAVSKVSCNISNKSSECLAEAYSPAARKKAGYDSIFLLSRCRSSAKSSHATASASHAVVIFAVSLTFITRTPGISGSDVSERQPAIRKQAASSKVRFIGFLRIILQHVPMQPPPVPPVPTLEATLAPHRSC